MLMNTIQRLIHFLKNMKPKKIKRESHSIYKEIVTDYTTKDNESDIRHERLTKVKKLFGITVYRREYSYDCDDCEKKRSPGFENS